MKKIKIAIIRGTYFTKFEMANYEPLSGKYKIVGFSGLNPINKNYKFPLVKLLSPVDLPSFPYKMPILNRLFLGDAMYLFGLEKALKGFDIAHVRETYFHFTQQALNAKRKGWVKKIVCTCSETIPFNHEGIWRRKKFKKRAIREVDMFHCHTQKAKDCLIKEGCNPEKIIVFPYGVDLKKFKMQKAKIKMADKNLKLIKLLFVGRLVKEKGVYDLLKAFVQLIKVNKNIKLTLIGKGPEEKNITDLISRSALLLDRIKLKSVRYTKIANEYRKNDIFVLLSKPTKYWEEYSSRALTEALACGLAIVATNCGGTREIIDKAGLLVKAGDWKQTHEALKKLIENTSLRKKLSSTAKKRALKYFDCQKVAEKISRLYKEVISG